MSIPLPVTKRGMMLLYIADGISSISFLMLRLGLVLHQDKYRRHLFPPQYTILGRAKGGDFQELSLGLKL